MFDYQEVVAALTIGGDNNWLLAACGVLVLLSVYLLYQSRDKKSSAAPTMTTLYSSAEPVSPTVSPGAIGTTDETPAALRERVKLLEDYLTIIDGRQQTMEQWRKPRSHYTQAIEGADRGAGQAELVKGFGLSEPEANLISQVYGNQR